MSEPGDYIGLGNAEVLTTDQFPIGFSAGADRNRIGIGFISIPQRRWFVMEMYAPNGKPLSPGVYDGAVSPSGGNPSTQPAFHFILDGRSCKPVSRFEVLDIEWGPFGSLRRLHGIFEQHCGVWTRPGLFGEFRLVQPVDLPPPVINLTLDPAVSVVNGGRTVKLSGRLLCSRWTNIDLSGSVSQLRHMPSKQGARIATGSFSVKGTCYGSDGYWTAEITHVDDLRFGAGKMQVRADAVVHDRFFDLSVDDSVMIEVDIPKAGKTQ